jgi:hypothetical protein
MGRWGLADPELLKALEEDPELVGMVKYLAAENGEAPIELLSRLLREQFMKELDTAFESAPGSRYRRILAELFGGEVPVRDPDDECIDGL